MRKINNKSFWIGNLFMVLFVSSCGICTYDWRITRQRNVELLKQLVDSAEIKYYIDKKYNVKLFYPDFIHIADTSKAGAACFKYMCLYSKVYLEQSVDTNLFKTNVEKAVIYLIYLTDSTAVCLDRGEDWYLAKGKSFLRKSFLIDGNWIEYTLSYTKDCEEVIGRLIDLMKEWEPRKER